jgi:hypothetical protein
MKKLERTLGLIVLASLAISVGLALAKLIEEGRATKIREIVHQEGPRP